MLAVLQLYEANQLGYRLKRRCHALWTSRVQARSRGGRWSWTLKRARERSRTGRWSWALIESWTIVCFSCSSTVAFRTLKQQLAEVHKLLHTGGVPTSLTLLFWQWLTVSSACAGRSAWTSYLCLLLTPTSPFSPVPNKPYSFCGR